VQGRPYHKIKQPLRKPYGESDNHQAASAGHPALIACPHPIDHGSFLAKQDQHLNGGASPFAASPHLTVRHASVVTPRFIEVVTQLPKT
jgi:hypothetical protein